MAPPDRWMDYSPMGERISGTRFICMKVPLKPHLSQNIDEENRFTCETAIKMATSKGYNIGLVIDLSFTKKYYNPADFENKNIKYKKIFVPGRVIPEKSVINEFKDTVANFETENKDNEDLIAVHCTHGLNRTGFMICRHLIDEKNFEPKDAIDKFETARGYKIEREIYLNNLLGIKGIDSPHKPDTNANLKTQLRPRSPSREYWSDYQHIPRHLGPPREYRNHFDFRDCGYPQHFTHHEPAFQDYYGRHGNFAHPPRQYYQNSHYYNDNHHDYYPDHHPDRGHHKPNHRYYPYRHSIHENSRWSMPPWGQKR